MAQLQIQSLGLVEEQEEEKVPLDVSDANPIHFGHQEEIVQNYSPKMMQKQFSAESSGEDSTISELNNNDFSIQVTKGELVSPPVEKSSYFSYLTPLNNSYVVFVVETKSRLPMYDGENKLHKVMRRFSDFEYLLKQLQDKPEFKSYCFPTLPEKALYGNLDEAFIEKRRVELEGFLRVLV